MSTVFVIGQIVVNWQEAALVGLLGVLIIIWIIWVIKALASREPISWGVGSENRPGLPELALAVVSTALLAMAWAWLLKGVLESQGLESAAAGGLAELASCLLILGLLGWKVPDRLKSLGLTVKRLGSNMGWGLLLALAVWPLASILLGPASRHIVRFLARLLCEIDYTTQMHPLIHELSENPTASNLWLVVMLAGVIAPLTEEIFFRGFLQGALAQLFRSRWIAIIGTAAIFSMFHMPLENIPALFFLGVVLGYAYEKSGSLYRPMAIHMVFNSLSLLTAFWKAT